jgi:hypothetical protein
MKMQDARKLHNGDEVVAKENKESIRVLKAEAYLSPKRPARGKGIFIKITGVGTQTGYGTWGHTEVK